MCLNPIRATFEYHQEGHRVIREAGRPVFHPEGELKLPCGKCHECISKRALEWATRAKHEISLHKENCFITLTYDDNHRPDDIIKSDFQKFIKRLRKKHKKTGLRYMVSYEYGTETSLPHMHAILFGYNFKDQKLLKYNKGNPLFTSKHLTALWDKGFHSIAEANEKTAYYIASYALKGNEKEVINEESGEVLERRDCMDVSKRPAIGLKYFLKNAPQICENGILPRYYEKKLQDPQWCLEKYPEYANIIKEFDTLADEVEERKNLNLKERGDHEIYARFNIQHKKTSLHSTEFRENNGINKKDNRPYKRNNGLKKELKYRRDQYADLTRRKT